MSDTDRGPWAEGAGDLKPRLDRIFEPFGLPPLRQVPRIAAARRQLSSPDEAGGILRGMDLVAGWRVTLSPGRSEVGHFGTEGPGEGSVATAEAVDAQGRSWRVGSDGEGLVIWGYDLSGGDSWPGGFDALPPVIDVLVERRRLLGTGAVAALLYDVAWKRTEEFGLRPRLSVLAGIELRTSQERAYDEA